MKGERGFTLIEVLIATTIAVLVLGAVYASFASVTASRRRVAAESEVDRRGRVLFDRLGRELRSAWRPESGSGNFQLAADDDGRQELRFATAATTLTATGRGGIAALRYRLQEVDGQMHLRRHEQPYYQRDALANGNGDLLCDGLRELRWRVRAGGDWQDHWSGEGWPQQVEVTVTLVDGAGDAVLRSVFELPTLGGTP